MNDMTPALQVNGCAGLMIKSSLTITSDNPIKAFTDSLSSFGMSPLRNPGGFGTSAHHRTLRPTQAGLPDRGGVPMLPFELYSPVSL